MNISLSVFLFLSLFKIFARLFTGNVDSVTCHVSRKMIITTTAENIGKL